MTMTEAEKLAAQKRAMAIPNTVIQSPHCPHKIEMGFGPDFKGPFKFYCMECKRIYEAEIK